MTAKNRSLKVGGFVFVALVLATVAVFLIGDNRRQWDRKMTYRAKFNDVVGLRAGSAVRMGGIDVGSVTSIAHAEKADDSKVYVTISVARNEARRVRPDSLSTRRPRRTAQPLRRPPRAVFDGQLPDRAGA